MKSDRWLAIAGDSPVDQTVRLAGTLAESGVGSLVATMADFSELTIATRTTDLPGLILSGRVVGLRCQAMGLLVKVGNRLEFASDRTDIAARLAAADSAGERRG